MARYFEEKEQYLTSTFEIYLELRTGREEVVLEDFSDLQAFLDEEGVPYSRSHGLDFPPSESEDLGELIRFVNDMEVVE
ncbi:MAG: hypothetical protein ABEK10_02400 [Candidatus Nanosalina sp.]